MRIVLALLLLMQAQSLPSTSREGGWRGIVPLKSTRADVERLLGKPNGLGRYEFENERAHIDYAKGCNQSKNCLCLVPKDTVISIFVTLESDLKLSDLKIDLAKYKKKQSSHLPGIVNFSDEEEGITYTVDEGDKEVMHITYTPRRLDCQNLINRVRAVKHCISRQRCKHARQLTESWNILFDTKDIQLIDSLLYPTLA